ncbi:uncharacterized protein B0H18DRAFT_1121721 [Fomitopsis serialis]|uniref:uncharacterized protein n=1 Tax=Fomitopsis serialis TaxID=139415 RepID=UPI00200842B7|nr:uncharacterized protein B0H18DRAFT_1121721 [Neoantrodia serialis]KAH9920761.1 hypothetical protein B0H18DRAFT_1121721 [Neoantrodia serialis]
MPSVQPTDENADLRAVEDGRSDSESTRVGTDTASEDGEGRAGSEGEDEGEGEGREASVGVEGARARTPAGCDRRAGELAQDEGEGEREHDDEVGDKAKVGRNDDAQTRPDAPSGSAQNPIEVDDGSTDDELEFTGFRLERVPRNAASEAQWETEGVVITGYRFSRRAARGRRVQRRVQRAETGEEEQEEGHSAKRMRK